MPPKVIIIEYVSMGSKTQMSKQISQSFDSYAEFGEWFSKHFSEVDIISIADYIKNLPAEGVDLSSKPDESYLEIQIPCSALTGDFIEATKFSQKMLITGGFDLCRPIQSYYSDDSKYMIFKQRREGK